MRTRSDLLPPMSLKRFDRSRSCVDSYLLTSSHPSCAVCLRLVRWKVLTTRHPSCAVCLRHVRRKFLTTNFTHPSCPGDLSARNPEQWDTSDARTMGDPSCPHKTNYLNDLVRCMHEVIRPRCVPPQARTMGGAITNERRQILQNCGRGSGVVKGVGSCWNE